MSLGDDATTGNGVKALLNECFRRAYANPLVGNDDTECSSLHIELGDPLIL